jgi:osmotically inducible protein OsmC
VFLWLIVQRYRRPRNKVLVHSRRCAEASRVNLIIRKASVCWNGNSKGGTRSVTTWSGVLKQTKLSLGIPLRKNIETDPAELIAAAHSSSFSSALSKELKLKTAAAGSILTTATVTMECVAGVWTIMSIHLAIAATLPKMTQGRFIDATIRAKTSCLVSRVLRANISMTAKLEN